MEIGIYLLSPSDNRMTARIANRFSRTLLLAPFIFICHFLEEAPTFVQWFNSHVPRGITAESFWAVNLTGLVITLVVVAAEWLSRSAFTLIVAMAWFSFLMFANAILHITGGLVDRQYVPGLVTAVLFYVPYFSWVFMEAVRSKRVNSAVLFVAGVLGAIPMLVHGYLIIFRASRLF